MFFLIGKKDVEALTNLKLSPNQAKVYFLIGGIIYTILGLSFNFIWVISRPQISISYILISVGISSLIFYCLYYIYEVWGKDKNIFQREYNFISIMGKNAFMLFLIHLILASFFYLILPLNIPLLLIILIGLFNVLIIWLLAYFMNKFEIILII